MIKDNIVFLREFFSEFQHTGTFCPTSRWAADVLVRPLRCHRGTKRIVELGAGTGAVTVRILEHMIDGDEVTICEINPRFMEALKARLERNRHYQARKHQVKFFEGPAQELPEQDKVDVIICALPFLNFELSTVAEIFGKLQRMSLPTTVMTYYEYIGLRPLGKLFSLPERKRRIKELDSFFRGLYSHCLLNRTPVWLNILPINIYALRMAA